MTGSIRDDVIRVARQLGDLNDRVVLVGGAAVYFLVPSSKTAEIRPTDDIDLIVTAAKGWEIHELGEKLRERGFSECRDEDAPSCRWVLDGIRVDIVPTDEAILGFSNRWYATAMRERQLLALEPGLQLYLIDVASFLGTKLEALASRGGDDYVASADFEDIVSVVAYRDDVLELTERAPRELGAYLIDSLSALANRSDLSDLISGCLPADRASQNLVAVVLDRFRAIAARSSSS